MAVFFCDITARASRPFGSSRTCSGPSFLFLFNFVCLLCIREIVATSGHIQNKQHSCTECVESKERHKVDWINAYIADRKKEVMLFLREMEEHRLLS